MTCDMREFLNLCLSACCIYMHDRQASRLLPGRHGSSAALYRELKTIAAKSSTARRILASGHLHRTYMY